MSIETASVLPDTIAEQLRASILNQQDSPGATITEAAVALRFSDSTHGVSRAVEFVGDTTLLQSLWRVARGDGVTVQVALLAPRASAQTERRALADALRADIEAHLSQPL